ncbi:type III PLP-dependent enzyme [Angustibacter sp. McL0619]|uniref:type III PLP-dependent enzyme n=1 Tax=Angustibacter sp. McL0619 TaxID=3415676 RepID=UPI003CF286D1
MSAQPVDLASPLLPVQPVTSRPVAAPQVLSQTPVVRVDTAIVLRQLAALRRALPGVQLHYAVKANPARPVLRALARAGCRWDVASRGEIEAVLRAGGAAADMSYGNTVKRAADIAYAHEVGVRRFTFDSPGELAKLTEHAPGSLAMVRITTSGQGAGWALGGKFGCPPDVAADLLVQAIRSGHRVGVAFHVGSQQSDPLAWTEPVAAAARLREVARAHGADLAVVDLGGGLPAAMREPTASLAVYGAGIRQAVARFLGPDVPELMAEPGRAMVAEAGVLETEVLLVSERAGLRWVYLDAGVFTGLVETVGEGIRYRVEAVRDGAPLAGRTQPAVLAGPTCDSLDVLYVEHPYQLPTSLQPGDRLLFHSTGAYTATYSTVGFNGFAPLREVFT